MDVFDDKRKDFQSKYEVADQVARENSIATQVSYRINRSDTFNPNEAAKEIENERFHELAKLLKDTPHERLILFNDAKVQELIDYMLHAIIIENARINLDSFPIEVYSRIKAFNSTRDKKEDYASRKERKTNSLTDYLAIRIVPESEFSIFYAEHDAKLQEMIDKREQRRQFIVETYKNLSERPEMTCQEYCDLCSNVIDKLKEIFSNSEERCRHYDSLKETLDNNLKSYTETIEDPNELLHFEELTVIVETNIRKLLKELKLQSPNEVTLYILKQNIMNVFEQSELLRSYRNFNCI